MAITGLLLMGYVLAHMVGNLKLYLPDNGAELNEYAEWLRGLLYPAFPRTVVLWIMRLGLLAATLLHIHAAYALTMHEPPRAAAALPGDAQLRRGGLRGTHDALDRGHRRALRAVPPART